jgi:tripartite ATP-independent transporter DctM subunit
VPAGGGPVSPTAIGAAGIVAMLVLIGLRVPIGVAMGLVGFLGFGYLNGWSAALALLGLVPYGTAATFALTVVPLFVMMGHLATMAGLSEELYDTANRWFGHLPGGLAMATVVACGGFAAICGSSLATAATMGGIALPAMRKVGYDPRLATGCVAAGGTLGILIPPSVVFLIYGFLTEQSIGKLFLAGIAPGIVLVTLFVLTIAVVTRLKPSLGPPVVRTPIRERLAALRRIAGVVALFGLVIGGMYVGVFTAAEAAAVGAFGAFVVAAIRRAVTRRSLLAALVATATTTAMIFAILIGAMILGYFMAVTRVPMALASFLAGLPLSPSIVMILIILTYVILGGIMDSLAMVLLTVPIFFPVVQALGYDPVWFGVVLVILVEVGLITPPVGMNVFVISGMSKGVPIPEVFLGTAPFLVAIAVLLGILMLVPDLALLIPRTMR